MTMTTAMTVVRYAVFGVVAVAAALAFGAMAVQRRMLNPFGRPARGIRNLTDPMLKPIERRILRSGGNPQSAPWWLIGVALVLGIVTISGIEWLLGQGMVFSAAVEGGGRNMIYLLVSWTFNLLMISLFVRFIGSWIGATEYTKWFRPFFLMTEWMLQPIRRIMPLFGPFDFSPAVAWLLLTLLRPVVLGLF